MVSLADIKQLDVPNLIINIWSYNVDKKHLSQCNICQKYNQYSVQALQQKWKNSWGDFHVVVQKIQENDKNFIDAGSYSSCNRHGIIRLLEVCAQKK